MLRSRRQTYLIAGWLYCAASAALIVRARIGIGSDAFAVVSSIYAAPSLVLLQTPATTVRPRRPPSARFADTRATLRALLSRRRWAR